MTNHDAFEKDRKKFIESTKPEISERYGFLFLAVVALYFGGHILYYLYTH